MAHAISARTNTIARNADASMPVIIAPARDRPAPRRTSGGNAWTESGRIVASDALDDTERAGDDADDAPDEAKSCGMVANNARDDGERT